jgi:hypothetical protein
VRIHSSTSYSKKLISKTMFVTKALKPDIQRLLGDLLISLTAYTLRIFTKIYLLKDRISAIV